MEFNIILYCIEIILNDELYYCNICANCSLVDYCVQYLTVTQNIFLGINKNCVNPWIGNILNFVDIVSS